MRRLPQSTVRPARPIVDIADRVIDNGGNTGRTAGNVNSNHVVTINCEQTVRIRLSQIVLCGKWDFFKIVQRPDIRG